MPRGLGAFVIGVVYGFVSLLATAFFMDLWKNVLKTESPMLPATVTALLAVTLVFVLI